MISLGLFLLHFITAWRRENGQSGAQKWLNWQELWFPLIPWVFPPLTYYSPVWLVTLPHTWQNHWFSGPSSRQKNWVLHWRETRKKQRHCFLRKKRVPKSWLRNEVAKLWAVQCIQAIFSQITAGTHKSHFCRLRSFFGSAALPNFIGSTKKPLWQNDCDILCP